MRMNSVRMLWGRGVRAGLYPLSDTEAYWFTTKNCSSVSSLLALASPGCALMLSVPESQRMACGETVKHGGLFAAPFECTPLL